MSLTPCNTNMNLLCNPMMSGLNYPMMNMTGLGMNYSMMGMNLNPMMMGCSIFPYGMMGGYGCGCGNSGGMDKTTQILLGTTLGLATGSSKGGQELGKGIAKGAVWSWNNAVKPAWNWFTGLFHKDKA